MIRFIPEWLRALLDPGAAAPGLEAAAPYLVAALAIGYLLGAIPFGLLMARVFRLGDLRKVGSGNIGATNVLRTANKGAAAATLVLDALKGALAVWLARGWWGPDAAVLARLRGGDRAYVPGVARVPGREGGRDACWASCWR